ncbi:MAG TPA: DUF3592 domain-containing protein [Actinomycetes bacterium]|nr:DUF3592 domain-containing protein [Actinomycetes bacterium]
MGVLLYLVFGTIFLAIAKPDLLNRYAWGLVLAADGVALLLGLVRPALRMRGLLKSGAAAEGTVVGTVQKTGDGALYFHPRVQFTTAEGRTVEFTSTFSSQFAPRVGDPVPVRYRPDRPEQAEADGATMWMLPAAVGTLFGLGLLVAGIIAILPG